MSSKSAKFRQRQKEEDPEAYQRYLQRQREAGAARRKADKEEPLTRARQITLDKRREKHREAQRKYQERKSAECDWTVRHRARLPASSQPLGLKRPKDMTPDEKREHDNRLKREWKERQTPNKKRWIRRHAREYIRKKRAAIKENSLGAVQESPPLTSAAEAVPVAGPSTPKKQSIGSKAKKTLQNMKWRVKKMLRTTTPDKCAQLMEGLSKPKTPEYKAAIMKRDFLKSPKKSGVKRKIFGYRPKKKPRAAKTKAVNLLRSIKSKRRDDLVINFYLRDDISRPLPHKRYATKAGAAHVMNLTIRGAWRQFQVEYPLLKVGYVKFWSLKPKTVRKLGSVGPDTCLCIYCLNIW